MPNRHPIEGCNEATLSSPAGLECRATRRTEGSVVGAGVDDRRSRRPSFPPQHEAQECYGFPQLVIFWDRSNSAFSYTIYTRWPLEYGGYSVILLAAKAKLAPKYATSSW